MKRWIAIFAISSGLGAAGGAHAQCAGFTDTANDGFCPNVEWVKNRAITTGCTSTTLYCPGNNVTRLQMAAFMNRLGRALTPEVLDKQVTFGAEAIPGFAPTPALIHCVTADTLAATYPRQAVITGSLTGLADGSTAGFNVFLLVSTDSGTSYANLDAALSIGQRATAAPNSWGGAAVTEKIALAVNTPYRFAIGIRRDNIGPLTTGNFAGGRCQLTATVFNRNGTSTPFDAQ